MNKPAAALATSLAQVIDDANRLVDAGRAADAMAVYQAWIRHDTTPMRKVAWFNLAVLHAGVQQTEEARRCYEAALDTDPNFHQARLNLGLTLERLGLVDEALAVWSVTAQAVAEVMPASEDWPCLAMNQSGRLLEQQKRLAPAEEVLHRSLLRDPQQPDVLQHYLHLRQKQLKWPITAPVPGVTSNDMLMAMSPLSMLAYVEDPALQLLAARNFVARKLPAAPARTSVSPRRAHERLRIGYLSGDLCTHAVGLMLAQVMEAHDRSRFETFAFDYSPQDGTAHRARLLQAFEHVHAVAALPDDTVAGLIAACEIDVLVDLHGLSSGLRAGVLARRPAPVQVTYLGFIGTTAMPWIDYVIGDGFALPDALAPYFSEKFLRLRTCLLPVDQRRYQSVPVIDRRSEGLPEDAVVFGAFNNSYKITQPMVDLWVRILQQVPGSVLWLVDDNPEATRRLQAYAAGQGLEPSRLVFSARASTERYQSRLRLIDLFLDCFPYNAGSTACDVVHMGTPLLTLPGRTFVSRMAGSLLHHLGLPELIVSDPQAYVDAAVSLGRDRERLAQLRQRVVQAVEASMGATGFTRELERVLVQAHEGVEPAVMASDLTDWPSGPLPVAVQTRAPATIDPARVHPYQIGYSQDTFDAIAAPWLALDYRTNDRPDWQEYWPIRRFLLGEPMREGDYYGFLSPRFTEKTGLDAAGLTGYMAQLPDTVDVVLFSPQPDMGAFFLNVFEQNELFDPGFTASAQTFCERAGLPVDLGQLVMDSRQIVFSNYFLAKPAFWRRWLALCEVLFGICENQPQQALEAGFLARTNYRDGIERKVFLVERLASLLLVLEPAWNVHAFNTFRCAYSASRLNEFRDEAVISDALKIAMSVQKHNEYTSQFANIRNKLRS